MSAKLIYSLWLALEAAHVHFRPERSLWGIVLDVMLNIAVAANRTMKDAPVANAVQHTTLGDLQVPQRWTLAMCTPWAFLQLCSTSIWSTHLAQPRCCGDADYRLRKHFTSPCVGPCTPFTGLDWLCSRDAPRAQRNFWDVGPANAVRCFVVGTRSQTGIASFQNAKSAHGTNGTIASHDASRLPTSTYCNNTQIIIIFPSRR